MVNKWQAINPLTIEERRLIKEGLDLNLPYRAIGKMVGRSHTTIRSEVKRFIYIEDYDPDKAQEDFEYKQTLCGIKKKDDTLDVICLNKEDAQKIYKNILKSDFFRQYFIKFNSYDPNKALAYFLLNLDWDKICK